MKKDISNPILRSWEALNKRLRTANEKDCQKLLEEELAGRRRRVILLRIHSRLNKVRAARERAELKKRAS